MPTTIRLDDALHTEVHPTAASRETTVTYFIEEPPRAALARHHERDASAPYRVAVLGATVRTVTSPWMSVSPTPVEVALRLCAIIVVGAQRRGICREPLTPG